MVSCIQRTCMMCSFKSFNKYISIFGLNYLKSILVVKNILIDFINSFIFYDVGTFTLVNQPSDPIRYYIFECQRLKQTSLFEREPNRELGYTIPICTTNRYSYY